MTNRWKRQKRKVQLTFFSQFLAMKSPAYHMSGHMIHCSHSVVRGVSLVILINERTTP